MSEMKSVTVRSLRKDRWWWVDNEVLDIFGDDLGPYGITLYAVLARHCFGSNFRVSMSLRELELKAHMKKDSLRRTLKRMVELGLLIQHKGITERSKSDYDLVDVKDLVEKIRHAAKELASGLNSVAQGDRSDEGSSVGPQGVPDKRKLTNRHISSGDASTGTQDDLDGIEELGASDLSPQTDSFCLPQRQTAEAPQKLESGAATATDLSQNDPRFATDLSLSASRVLIGKTKDKKTQDGAVAGESTARAPDETGLRPPSRAPAPKRHSARLMELLGLAASKSDLDLVDQVIAYEARGAHADPEEACIFLLDAAQRAMKRGETVNVFWFKDRKFANGGGNDGGPGKAEPSPTRTRIERNRAALERALAKRGVRAPWLAPEPDASALPEPGSGGDDGGVSGGLRAAGAEVLPPRGSRGSGGAED